jgi:PKD repeat protein
VRSDVTSGALPLTVNFDGTGSSDPDPGDAITYAWDLDGDGAFDDSTASRPARTYTTATPVTVRMRVRDRSGLTAEASVRITPGNRPPAVTITTPEWSTTSDGDVATSRWIANGTVWYRGEAVDPEDGPVPASRLQWDVTLQHCSLTGECHAHPHLTRTGVAAGSFTAPDHEYPAYLDLVLRATDSQGLTGQHRVRINPRTVNLTFTSSPSGLTLAVDDVAQVTPFSKRMIYASRHTIAAPSPQTLGGRSWTFSSWSDGGERVHTISARDNVTTSYAATYR